ncbi:MAG: hypothetical protein ACI8UR_000094 [Natronomonas sp.]|jgi:hypothetical protein
MEHVRITKDEAAVLAWCTACGTKTGQWVRGSMPGTVP